MQFLPLGVVAQSTRRIQKCYVRCQVRQNQNHWGPVQPLKRQNSLSIAEIAKKVSIKKT